MKVPLCFDNAFLKKKTRKSMAASAAPTSKKSSSRQVDNLKQTMILKGRVPVDFRCHQKMSEVKEAHVYEEGEVVWDAMLTFFSVEKKKNLFYILQLLEETHKFIVWFRCGRVGDIGKTSFINYGGDLKGAKDCFTAQFRKMTGNKWDSNFEAKQGMYILIHMDYSVTRDEALEDDMESKLDKQVQELLKWIRKNQVVKEPMQIEFDYTLSPLGKLAKLQIDEGYRILGELKKKIMHNEFGEEFVRLVNEYYTKIPHKFDLRQKPPLIAADTDEMKSREIQEETALLEHLENIKITVKSFDIDKYYKDMQCRVSPVEEGSKDYGMIENYMKTNYGDTDSFSMKITNIYQIERLSETKRFEEDIRAQTKTHKNRKLLWHGSNMTNFYGILSQGLLIAPSNAKWSGGYAFGKGIYFTDMASPAGDYSIDYADYPNFEPGLLLLCEVALGESYEPKETNCNTDKLLGELEKREKHSIKGIGKVYNEYVVYNVEQVRIRFLVKVEFERPVDSGSGVESVIS